MRLCVETLYVSPTLKVQIRPKQFLLLIYFPICEANNFYDYTSYSCILWAIK